MSRIEKEVKVLDIKVDEVKKSLLEIGAVYKGEKNQKIYVYDIPTLYYRFLEIKSLLNSDSKMIISTNIKKLENLMVEFTDFIEDSQLKKLDIDYLNSIGKLSIDKIRTIINDRELENLFSEFKINPNKWIRLRESNGKVELTTKHILKKKNNKFQNVIESEVEVSSLEEANLILESIGISRRSYQEKTRYSYKYKDAEIEIDLWPLLNPYLEIESDNEEVINEIIEKLKLSNYEIVSLNTEQLYKRINIDVHSMSELKF